MEHGNTTQVKTESSELKLDEDLNVNLKVQISEIKEKEAEHTKEIVYDVEFKKENDLDLVLHWGLSYPGKGQWVAPGKDTQPENTKIIDDKAVQTKFTNNLISIKIKITEENKVKSLNYVFHLAKDNKWYNNSNKDYSLQFKAVKNSSSETHPDFVEDIIKCEMEYGSWTLMHRYNKCYDIVNSIDDSGSLIWVYIWLRFSYLKILDWQRSFNTKPRELAYSMSRLTSFLTTKYINSSPDTEKESFRLSNDILYRMCLSLLGKGTGDGQKIRDEILQVLHKHHIKETNDHFYEQWHQKLHNNTTPDDVVICEALISYLKSNGDMSAYWKALTQGRVTKERLAGFDRKITCEPFYKPELIPDLEHFLGTLKAVHSSDDMVLMFESAKYVFNSGDCYKFQEIVNNKDHWDTLKQIYRVAEGRDTLAKIIKGNFSDSNKVRDLLFFDLCLENYLRQLVERIIHINLDFELYINEVTAITKNICLSYKFREMRLCLEDWTNICENLKFNIGKRNEHSLVSALKIKSVSDRMTRAISHVVDYFNLHYQPKAMSLGNAFKADKFFTDIFTEETIRGSIFFTLSMILKKVEPVLRQVANLGPQLVISRGRDEKCSGRVDYVKSLQEVQFKTFDKQTILLTSQVGGNEEVPPNVSCLVIVSAKDYPDVLAHVSVRARNLGVAFVVLFDDAISENLMQMKDKNINMKIGNRNIEYNEITIIPNNSSGSTCTTTANEEENLIRSVNISDGFDNIILKMEDFTKQCVGAKSNNTKRVFGNLPSWVKYPESMAIPFNVCEYFLEFEENLHIKSKLESLTKLFKTEKDNKISEILFECKKILMKLNFVENEETKKIKAALLNFGMKENVCYIIKLIQKDFKSAWRSIKGVWCSKYNERAFIATKKVGIKIEDIRMAVLIQKIIPAEYAFVIHTKNPSTNDDNELYAEVVVGMGETLVGTYEGQSFAFTFNKKTSEYAIHSFPNKSIILKNKGYIFRSDSNTEDLEGFAGAGLFDSIPLSENQEVYATYNMNEIFTSAEFVNSMMKKISGLGIEVENIYNYPQDIEGVIYNNEYFIVQTRPQV